MEETIRSVVKIFVLIFLMVFGTLICVVNFDFGDYCKSAFGILVNFVLVFGYLLFLFCFLTFNIDNFQKKYLLLLILFCVLVLGKVDFKKLYSTPNYIGEIENERGKKSKLILFDNHTFKIIYQRQHHRCFFNGNYSLENGQLFLDRNDLSNITDSLFTFEYRLNSLNKFLTPKHSVYSIIKIK